MTTAFTAEDYRTAAAIAESMGNTFSGRDYLRVAESLEAEATGLNQLRDKLYEHFESLYFAADMTLKESVNGLLDKLTEDGALDLTKLLEEEEEEPDYNRKFYSLSELDQTKRYTDSAGDIVEFRTNSYGDAQWSWRSVNSSGWSRSYSDHGPFKLARI